MPKTIALVQPYANAPNIWGEILAVLRNPDLVAATGFAAIGLLTTICVAASLFSLTDLAPLSLHIP